MREPPDVSARCGRDTCGEPCPRSVLRHVDRGACWPVHPAPALGLPGARTRLHPTESHRPLAHTRPSRYKEKRPFRQHVWSTY